MKLSEVCIKRPVFSMVLCFIIILLGLISVFKLPLRGFPVVDPPVLGIRTTYPGAAASVFENQVTSPIENELVGLSGLDRMHSTSKQGRSMIHLRFKLGTDID